MNIHNLKDLLTRPVSVHLPLVLLVLTMLIFMLLTAPSHASDEFQVSSRNAEYDFEKVK